MGPVTRVTRDPGCDSQVISSPGAQENARNRESTNYKLQITSKRNRVPNNERNVFKNAFKT